MSSANGWYKLRTMCPAASAEAMLGVTDFAGQRCWLYPDRVLKRGSTVIWVPSARAHVGIASYVDAVRSKDEAALARLSGLGVPPGISFGYGPSDDLSSTWTPYDEKKPRRKKADSVAVMRAQFAAQFEDGGRFEKGEVVKILFRKKFVRETASGCKKFENVYLRPSAEELAEFLGGENKEGDTE